MIEEKKIQVPIYERLAPKECLIINKTKTDLCNEEGKPKVKRIPIPYKKVKRNESKLEEEEYGLYIL